MTGQPSTRPTSQPTRAAILGTGFIADFHARALQATPGVQLAAICDVDASKAAEFRSKWQISEAYDSLCDLLSKSRPDVVHILVPPALHCATAVQCLSARTHVFIEKPVALSLAECDRIAEAARLSGGIVGVNHNQACHPAFLRAEEETRKCRLGRIEHVSTFLSAPLRQLSAGQHNHWMFREPGNILLEQAPHPLSQIIRLLGPVRSAACSASGAQTLSTGKVFFDTWQVSLVCERGPAQLLLAFGRDHLEFSLQIIGQDATAHVDLRRNTIYVFDKTRFVEPMDQLINNWREGRSLASQGLTNFRDYCLGFLKLRPPSDTFSVGMNTSIQRFYGDLHAGVPPRMGLPEARAVIEACEKIAAAADVTRSSMQAAAESPHVG
jgi:predicted dehydrogenase